MTVPSPPADRPRDPADAFVDGPAGRFWGLEGAAGLLAHDPGRGVLLQLRAGWSHHGGTWGLPGGALHTGEAALAGALREAAEEACVPAEALTVAGSVRHDVGYWSYTTVVAEVTTPFEPRAGDAESVDLVWVPVAEVESLPLHPGLAGSWPRLRAALERPGLLVVDVANVMGSRPDGWWRDRASAARRLVDQVSALVAHGIPGAVLGASAEWTLFPETIAVVEGQARGIVTQPGPAVPRPGSSAATPSVQVLVAPADGDSTIVDLVAERRDRDVSVATSDRGLRDQVERLGARCLRAGTLLGELTRH